MKRYRTRLPGILLLKRAPSPRPDCMNSATSSILRASNRLPLIQDLASLLWVVNLGCIDLTSGMRAVMTRPAGLSDLIGSVPCVRLEGVDTALLCACLEFEMPCYANTTVSRNHVYVPSEPATPKQGGYLLKVSHRWLPHAPQLITAIYKVAKRPRAGYWWTITNNAGAVLWRRSIGAAPS